MNGNWDDLRVFLAVARAESLTGAGTLLKMDPATVGRRIARLEQGVGTVLFMKSPQGYVISDDGLRLMEHAEQAEVSLSMAASRLQGATDTLSGTIRIGAPDGCANYLLPQVCAEISDENPGLEVQVVALPRVFNLSKREADMAITVSAPTAGRLTVQKLTAYRLHLAASKDYLAKTPPLNTLRDLRQHRVIGYIPDMIFDKELDYLEMLKLSHVQLSSNSVSVQMNFIRQGAGIGVAHDFALPAFPDVHKVLNHQLTLTRHFYLVRYASDRGVGRLNRFAALLGAKIKREVSRLEALT